MKKNKKKLNCQINDYTVAKQGSSVQSQKKPVLFSQVFTPQN